MHRVNLAAVTSAVALAVLAGLPGAARAQVTAYEGARLIVGDGSAPIENATLLVDGTRIVQAGSGVTVPAGATRVSLAGKTVMPTIIDTHTHLSVKQEPLLRDLKRRGYFGVSAALSLGTDLFDTLPMRDQVVPGAARYFSAGQGITRKEPLRPTLQIETEAEGRKAVQQLAAHKVDIIKVWVDDREGKVQKVTPEQYAAIIDEAHKNGIRVIAHIYNMEDAKGLMRAGLDAFAHGVRDKDVDDETVAMFKARPNIVLGPNLPDRGVKVDLSWLKSGLPADEYAKLEQENTDRAAVQQFHGIQARNLAKMYAAGVRLTLGTDGNKPWGPHDEMVDMVMAGVPAMQVIVAATRNGAEFLKIADAGTLAAGKSADFIVLDANPLDNIANTQKIASVVLRGATVDRSKPVP
ncbi:MAG: hypothetical protein QOI12_3603 [Alphaproteobacteria bacterium]|jgi:imidazolonepropionase-like amidohydrolase|nr:hypothetical protein [Alphaproteobacteria bacterium]